MKYLSFLFFSIFIYAQQPYTDTLYMNNEKVFPCYLVYIGESSVKFIYSNNTYELATLQSISKISVNGYGIIYTSENGFSKDLDTLQVFLENRWEKLAKEKQKKEEAEKFKADTSQINLPGINRWSFGILYVPYSSSRLFTISSSGSLEGPSVYSIMNNTTYMEGQFAYRGSANLSVTFDIGYTLAFTEERDESHTVQDNYSYQNGYLDSKNLKLFDFMLGLKIYFKNFLEERATAYWLAGIGKQIAFGTATHENLFSSIQTENNAGEYLEDLNSPWHFNIGFGAEYLFNESLSLFSVMRFSYSIISAEYNSTTISGNQRTTISSQYKNSEITTDFGLGLNFYF